ncbi:MAG: c-type cytochrome [Burkholderiaceae bacterium]
MRRAKRLVAAALALLLAAGAAALYALNHLDEQPRAEAGAGPATAAPALVARGAYLARAGNCQGCHSARGGPAWAGGRAVPTPFGPVFSSNLTPDPDTGLGRWSADDFWAALHNGRGRDGRLLAPAFPYANYTLISRADADALHAYLRSLPAVVQPNRPPQLRFPYGTQLALAVWRAVSFRPGEFRPRPEQDAGWNRGAYLSQGLGHCNACHGARNALGATAGPAEFSGGMLAGLGWYAPSLQDDTEAGVTNWPAQTLVEWLKTGRNGHASALGPMSEVILGSTQHLDEADLAAMARYLQSLPPRARPRAAPPAPGPELLRAREQGGRLYAAQCARCHGERGEGVAGAYPALAGNRTVLMDNPANLLRVIERGGFAPATAGNPRPFGMPPFATLLDDGEMAALASYLRHSWGHAAGDVRPVDVLRLKPDRH